MKLHLPLSLRSSLLACLAFLASASPALAAFTPTADLGNTMYVGDSITHGIDVASWRWPMHKIFVDNGISYTEQGVMTGKDGGGYTNMNYGGVVFKNIHSAQSSARAYEISGQRNKASNSETEMNNGRGSSKGRFGGTNIMHWLNQEDCRTNSPNSTHASGYTIDEGTVINNFFIMIGTNDLLSDGLIDKNSKGLDDSGNPTGNLKKGMKSLLGWDQDSQTWTNDGDMDIILSSMRVNNSNAPVVVLTIPTWASQNRANSFDANDNREVQAYNEKLKEWAATKEGVTVVVSDRGLVDVANETWVGAGVASMFRPGTSGVPDWIHPTAHGDLLIAGNVARQLGYAGATAGQQRKSETCETSFEQHEQNITLASGGENVTYKWTTKPTGGFTAAFRFSDGLGNGAKDGWDTSKNFSVSVGNGGLAGTLNINEAYIQWGDTILYSLDTSDTTLPAGGAYANINDTIRIAYVVGNASLNLGSGFYVWMDDQLIGEALAATALEIDGVQLTNNTDDSVTLSDLWMDGKGSWAPGTTRFTKDNPLIEPGVIDASNPYADCAGVLGNWPTDLAPDEVLLANVASNVGASFEKGGIAIGSASSSNIFAISTARSSDLYLTLMDVSTSNWCGAVGTNSGSLNGDVYLRFLSKSEEAVSTGTWFAAVNSNGVTGNVYMEFSADNLTVIGSDFKPVNVSVAGVFNTAKGISGSLTLVFNAGKFTGDIIGGAVNGNGSVGAVNIYINGGTFTKNIAAGGYFGKVGDRSITITGDDMVFDGTAFITAGQAENQYFNRLNGNAPSNNASTGSATVTIADTTAEGGFGQYAGILSGGEQTTGGTRSLFFYGAQLPELHAQLQNFDSITLEKSRTTGKLSQVGLHGLGGATTINIASGNTLILLEGIELGDAPLTISNQGGTVILEDGVELTVGSTGDQQAASGEYVLKSGSSLTMTEDSLGGFTISMEAGSSLDLTNVTEGLRTTVSVDDSAEADGMAVYTIEGVAHVSAFNLKHFTAGSSIEGLTEEDEITLTGANRIVLKDDMNLSAEKALLQGGELGLDDNASLVVDINGLVSAMAQAESPLTYYLSKGGFADAEAMKSKMSFDATLVALGWKVALDEEKGAISFSRATGGELLGGKVLDSKTDEAHDVWSSDEIYNEIAGYDAVVVSNETSIDLTDKDVPTAFADTGLLIKNAMGDGNLTVTGEGDSKVTLSNRIDQNLIKEMEDAGYTVENSLTLKGNVTINNAQLRVEHLNPENMKADAESTTIVHGNVTVMGEGGVEMAGGVLELRGQENDFGEGALEFSAGDDGQVAGQVVVSGEDAKLTLHGEVCANGADAKREHIRLKKGGTLALADGVGVGSGVVIGDADGYIADYAHVAGTLAVAGDVKLSSEARVQYVDLDLAEGSTLYLVGKQVDNIMLMASEPDGGNAAETPNRVVRGLSGSGALVTHGTAGEEGYIVIAVAGGNHTFTGDLSGYNGTMYVAFSPYEQVFSGVKGGSGWNLVNYELGHVTFNLKGEDGKGSNSLTMGALHAESGSCTTILMDLSTPKRGGLTLGSLSLENGAYVTIGHYNGTTSLGGETGETHRIAIASVAGDYTADGARWWLSGVRNAELVEMEMINGTLYLAYKVNNNNRYTDVTTNVNSAAGARLLWAQGAANGVLTGDLGAAENELLQLMATPGGGASANRLLAAVAGASTAVVSQAVGTDTERQLRTMRNRAADMGMLPSDSKNGATSVWLNAESNYYKQKADGFLPGFKTNGWGGTVGLHADQPSGFSLGLALTAMYNDLESIGADRLKGDLDTFYLSALVHKTEGAWQHTFVATVGTAELDARRTVQHGSGSYTTHGSTDGMTFGLMYEVGYAIALDNKQSTELLPIANITWRYSQLNAYSETGSNAALSVAEQSRSAVDFGLGARLRSSMGERLLNTSGFYELRALVKAHAGDRSGESQVSFADGGLQSAGVRSAEQGAFSFELGAGVSLPLSSGCALFGDFSADLGSGRTDMNASLGIKLTF